MTKLGMLLISATLGVGQPSPLADIGAAPPVELTDIEGRPFSLESLKGKAVVVSFVYSTCNGTCPMTTATLDRVRKVMQREKLWGRSVEFVSITLDPTRDTPEALARYSRNYRIDPKTWHFLTGEPERVARVIASWDMWAKVSPSGVIDHPSRIFLLDPLGHRREIYSLETLTPEAVVRDVKLLLEEGAGTR